MKFLKKIIISILTILFVLYVGFVFILPQYLNSKNFNKHLNNFLEKNFKLKYEAEGFNYKTKYTLRVLLDATKISIYKDFDNDGDIENEEKLFYTENLHFSTGTLRHKTLHFSADYLIFNAEYLKEILPHTKTKSKSKFNFYDYISKLDIKHTVLIFSNDKNDKFRFDIRDLNLKKENKKNIITFNADVTSNLLKHSLKIGDSGRLVINGHSLESDNLSLLFGDAKVLVNGIIRNGDGVTDFEVNGKEIPVDDLEASLLYFQKLRKKDKVFIENFYDWGGNINAQLQFTNKGVFGKCTADNLFAKSRLFNVPILFKEAEFVFKGREVTSFAVGTIGFDDVVSDFSLTNMATPDQTVEGTVQSDLKNKSVSTYIPNTRVKGAAITTVKYHVKNHKIHVDYSVKVNKGSNLYYNDINLGLEDKNRTLTVNTFKHDDVLEITSYDYSMSDENGQDVIVTGEGLFRKKPKRLKLEYITCKTDGYAPISVAGSFGDYLHGGEFKGDLTYLYESKQIVGDFSVINSRYKRFRIDEADFKADKEKMDFNAKGTYRDEAFNCSASAKNDFAGEKIHIYDMDLFLDKFYLEKRAKKAPSKIAPPKNMYAINRKIKNNDITIDSWKIRVNQIIRNRIVLDHINVSGALKNNIFNFVSSDIGFADGTMSAKGNYNFKDSTSVVDFNAKNINSAIVADTVLGLPNQVEGIASAKIHAEANNKRKEIKAHAQFEIENGVLTNLGDKEFYLRKADNKHPWKVSLQKAINVDVTKEALTSDIKGSIDLDNFCLKNILLTSQQKYFAFAILGNYDISQQYADLSLFGKFNWDKQKGIKVFHIPLSMITRFILRPEKEHNSYTNELKNVPSIEADKNDIRTFKVHVQGNLNNTDDLKVDLKRINND